MTPQFIKEQLLKKARQKELAHFYILQGTAGDHGKQGQWVEQFIREYWTSVEGRKLPSDLRSDADLLWLLPEISDEGDLRDYKVENLSELFTFLGYRGIQSQKRFVVFEHSELITPIIANKLLKTLEEPVGDLTLFWLNPTGAKLLPTIESRALTLRLKWPHERALTPLLDELKKRFEAGLPLAEFLEESKKNFQLNQLLQETLEYEVSHDGPAQLKQELLDLIRTWNEAQIYHQSPGPTLMALHLYLSQRLGH